MRKDVDKCIKTYLGINDIVVSPERNNFFINETDDIKTYYEALAYLYDILEKTYYKNGIMLYILNDYLMTFDYKFDEIKILYSYAEKKGVANVCNFLGNFLLSLQYSIESSVYNESNIYDKLVKAFYESFSRKDFYNNGKYINNSLNYLNDLIISEQIEFDINFYFDNIVKIFVRAKGDDRYRSIFIALLEREKHLSKLFNYDYDHKEHRVQYNTYILRNVHEFKLNNYKFESAINLLGKLYDKQLLNEETYVETLNHVIIEINEIVEKYNLELDNTVLFISYIDQILSTLNKMKKCYGFYKHYDEKIEDCIRIILFCKRSYVKNERINSGMAVVEHELEIDKRKFDIIEKSLLDSYQNVFSILRMDFDLMLKNAIKSHSDHPLINLVSHVSINTEQGTYFNWNENSISSFSLYYNEEGNKMIELLADELVNVYRGDYYYLMIRYISTTFSMAGQLLILRFKDLFNDSFRQYICEDVIGVEGKVYKNDYVLCTHLILCIERLIYEQIEQVGLEYERKMSLNLESLFNHHKEDKISRDVYMLVNYILYDELGMGYRNNFMHGNFIHKNDLTLELLYIFTCAIGLLVVGNRNEK